MDQTVRLARREKGQPENGLRLSYSQFERVQNKIRVELRDSGVAGAVIFPDVDGLGRKTNSAGKT